MADAEDADGELAPAEPPPRPSRAPALIALALDLGRRFLAPTNLVELSTVGQYLLMAARAANRPQVTIDVHMRLVDPPSIVSPPLRLALLRLEERFRYQLHALGIDRNEILGATIAVRYDFATARPIQLKGQTLSVHMIEPEAVNYECIVRIRSAEGEHRAKVPEWWRE